MPARQLLAVNAGRPFDETLLRRYASHSDTVTLKPLDRLDDPTLYQRLDTAEQAAYARLERALERALSEREIPVRARASRFQPTSLSVALLAGQRVTAFDEMERHWKSRFYWRTGRIGREVRERLRSQPLTLLLNVDHPLVQRLGELPDPDNPRYRPLLVGLYHGALLNAQHWLTPTAARRFHADFAGAAARPSGIVA